MNCISKKGLQVDTFLVSKTPPSGIINDPVRLRTKWNVLRTKFHC